MNLDALQQHVFAPVEHDLSFRDTIIYALGLGYGSDPTNPAHLQFVYEEGLKAVPSMCCVMGYAGFWMREPQFEIDWVRLLHGEHAYRIHAPLPVDGRVTAHHRITGVSDKGEGRGAVVTFEKELRDATGTLLATIRQSNFLRGDGGCGSWGEPLAEPALLPDRSPDVTHEVATSRQIALLYRLSGDYNPVHADPEVARQAGMAEPWVAGMCSMGMATRSVIERLCDNDPSRIGAMLVRFRSVLYPGETVRFEYFLDDGGARFRAVCVERDVVILDRGDVRFTPIQA